MNRQAAAQPQVKSAPPKGPVLRRKCACGQHTGGEGECDTCRKEREEKLQRSAQGEAPGAGVPPIVHEVLGSPGQALDAAHRAMMESRFQQDFSGVRVHTDGRAAESAQAVAAHAYAVGRHVVFGADRYRPETRNGQRLLAHELAHVVQQRGAPDSVPLEVGSPSHASEREAEEAAERAVPQGEIRQRQSEPAIRRVGIWESIVRFFGGGTFSPEELKQYLAFLDKNHRIEDHYDSDNKARDIVRRWKQGEKDFAILTVPTRALLIEEMITGHPSNADQRACLELLRESIVGERTAIFQKVGVAKLRSAFDGKDLKELNSLIETEEEEAGLESLDKWSAEGVMKILSRHGDVSVIDFILREGYTILSFTAAFDKWRYPDGHEEENEIPNLLGNSCSVVRFGCPRPKEIRLNEKQDNERASSTLFHEANHAEKGASEEDARIEEEKFRIRHGMPASQEGYRKPDGTVNEAFIRGEIGGDPHYHPVGRTRVARRYEGEKKVEGWHLPSAKGK